MRVPIISVLCVATALGGCATNLDVRKLEPDKPRIGLGYTLPFSQYTATITWRVAECVPGVAAKPATARTPAVEALESIVKIAAKVEIVDGQADDAENSYIFDPNQLQSAFSISSFQVKWQDGRNLISTINVSNEDRTAQVIGKSVTGIGKLALSLAKVAGAPGLRPPNACTDDTIQAVQDAKDQKVALELAGATVRAAQAKLKATTDKVAAMGVNVSEPAKVELADAIDSLNKALKAQASKSGELEETLRAISYVKVVYWPEKSTEFFTPQDAPFKLTDLALQKWVSLKPANEAEIITQTQVYFSLHRLGSFGRGNADNYQTPVTLSVGAKEATGLNAKKSDRGLRYRMPAMGQVFACSSFPCDASAPEIYARLEAPVAQLGFVNVLPIETRRFGSTVFAGEFTGLGALKSAGYEQKSSPAENIAQAFADVVDASTPVIDYKAGAITRREAKELSDLKLMKDKRDALLALQQDPVASVSESAKLLSADTALLNAKISNLEAQITLAETQAKMARTAQ